MPLGGDVDRQLRRASRRGTDLDYFRQRLRAGEIPPIPQGCRACGGRDWTDHMGNLAGRGHCPDCNGTGEAPVEERLRMAANLGHKGALDEVGPSGRTAVFTLSNPIRWVEKRWGPLAAAACVRGAHIMAFHGEDCDDNYGAHCYELCVVARGEDRAREAARQAGIRWALGLTDKILPATGPNGLKGQHSDR